MKYINVAIVCCHKCKTCKPNSKNIKGGFCSNRLLVGMFRKGETGAEQRYRDKWAPHEVIFEEQEPVRH